MNRLIHQVKIVDPQSKHHLQVVDVLLDEDRILAIWRSGNPPPDDVELIDGKGKLLSPAWFDFQAQCGEPEKENVESYETLKAAAAYGGFGYVGVLPNSGLVRDKASLIKEVINTNKPNDVQLMPLGAWSVALAGKKLAEVFDMSQHGAIGFTDGAQAIPSNRLLDIGLNYAKSFDLLSIFHPEDTYLNNSEGVSESETALNMGLRGASVAGEIIALQNLIALAEHTGARIHISQISLAQSVKLIDEAKKKGIHITCGVSVQHLYFTEQDVLNFDVNLKLNLPLRNKKDQLALRKALAEGIIDVIVSNHQTCTTEEKRVEFDFASRGTQALEAFAGAAYDSLKEMISAEELVILMSHAAFKIIKREVEIIEVGNPTGFTLFDPNESYVFQADQIKNQWKNCAYINRTLTGKAVYIP